MSPSASPPAVYQTLLKHLHTIVAGRDRTGLNGAVLLATRALFDTGKVSLLRVLSHNGSSFVVPCGTALDESPELQDAYLISPQRGFPLAEQVAYQYCCDSALPTHCVHSGIHSYVFPLFRQDTPYALLEIERGSPLIEQDWFLLGQLLGLFLAHLDLIDYAETDTLTGLLNRKTFDENLTRVLASAGNDDSLCSQGSPPGHHVRRRAGQASASHWLAVFDIDHFKRVNDTYGHIIGDEVLLLVAQLMRRAFRFDDQLFRFGGEEFVTVLQPAAPADALTAVERFRRSIEASDFPIVGRVTISCGLTRIGAMDTPTELVGRADQALYFAKENGRNRAESYEELQAQGLLSAAHASKPKAELF